VREIGSASQSAASDAVTGVGLPHQSLQPAARDPARRGRISAALRPSLGLAGFLGLILLVIYMPNQILIIILLLSGSELWRRWRLRRAPELLEYYRVRPQRSPARRSAPFSSSLPAPAPADSAKAVLTGSRSTATPLARVCVTPKLPARGKPTRERTP
jgi:hypothetical protein